MFIPQTSLDLSCTDYTCFKVILDARRRSAAIKAGRSMPKASKGNYHMVLKGNPGTGKTTVARLIAKMLHAAGVLKTDKVIEVHRSSLVGEYVGQTGPKTRAKIDQARDGVLFIDEAYRLSQPTKSGQHDYGLEAIEELQQAMDEENPPLMIFAGYPDAMEGFVMSNPGLFRRISYPHIVFPNHSIENLATILSMEVIKQGFEMDLDQQDIVRVLRLNTSTEQMASLNGSIGEKVFQHAKHSLNSRICESDMDPSVTLIREDIEQGCKALPRPVTKQSANQPPAHTQSQYLAKNVPQYNADNLFSQPQPC